MKIKLIKFLYFIMLFLYVIPFSLLGFAKRHIMLFRFLVSKQYSWQDGNYATFTTIAFMIFFAIYLIILFICKKREIKFIKKDFFINVLVFIIFLFAININPFYTILFFPIVVASFFSFLISCIILILKVFYKNLQ